MALPMIHPECVPKVAALILFLILILILILFLFLFTEWQARLTLGNKNKNKNKNKIKVKIRRGSCGSDLLHSLSESSSFVPFMYFVDNIAGCGFRRAARGCLRPRPCAARCARRAL